MAYTATAWKNGDLITADLLNHAEEGINAASSAVDELKKATATATALAAGEAPTVTFDGSSFAFGIPAGAQGAQGAKGDKGDKAMPEQKATRVTRAIRVLPEPQAPMVPTAQTVRTVRLASKAPLSACPPPLSQTIRQTLPPMRWLPQTQFCLTQSAIRCLMRLPRSFTPSRP